MAALCQPIEAAGSQSSRLRNARSWPSLHWHRRRGVAGWRAAFSAPFSPREWGWRGCQGITRHSSMIGKGVPSFFHSPSCHLQFLLAKFLQHLSFKNRLLYVDIRRDDPGWTPIYYRPGKKNDFFPFFNKTRIFLVHSNYRPGVI